MSAASPQHAGLRTCYLHVADMIDGPAPRTPASAAPVRRFGMVAAAAAAAASLAATAAVAGWRAAVAGRPQQLRSGLARDAAALQVKATWVQGEGSPSLAPPMDIDTEYQVDGGWGTNFDHIPDPEMCAAMCQGVEKCKAFTWVKDAGLDGCPSQCWLKDAVGTKVPKPGLVSGVPPPRETLPPPSERRAKGLYCYALMVPGSYEVGLMQWQYKAGAGPFGCEKAALYSNQVIEVAPGYSTHVVNSTLKCGYGGDSMSALNSWIFIAVWYKVIEVGDYKNYNWLVKADPDCVFFPLRLERLLTMYEPVGYLNNCKYGMHGPIEVFSSKAIDSLAADYSNSWDGSAPKRCVEEQDFGQWGEDMFIDQCLIKVLEVGPRPTEPKLMCESHCDCPAWYWCQNGTDVISYHPFKTMESYSNCIANAMAEERRVAAAGGDAQHTA